MSDSLIEQVEKLADSQKCGALFEKLARIETGVYAPTWFYFDFPALLAHLQDQQAVVDAARKLREKQLGIYDRTEALAAGVDLDAALENLENRDGK